MLVCVRLQTNYLKLAFEREAQSFSNVTPAWCNDCNVMRNVMIAQIIKGLSLMPFFKDGAYSWSGQIRWDSIFIWGCFLINLKLCKLMQFNLFLFFSSFFVKIRGVLSSSRHLRRVIRAFKSSSSLYFSFNESVTVARTSLDSLSHMQCLLKLFQCLVAFLTRSWSLGAWCVCVCVGGF